MPYHSFSIIAVPQRVGEQRKSALIVKMRSRLQAQLAAALPAAAHQENEAQQSRSEHHG
jgi:hypothetical protein